MALALDYPDRQPWNLQVGTHREVPEVLIESQETDVRTLVNAFEDESVSKVSFSVMDVAACSTHKHEVDDLLTCVPVLVKERIVLKVHVVSDVVDLPGENNAVN